MKKGKILTGRKPPANMDGVPDEELTLAEMISNAEEHDFRFETGVIGLTLKRGRYHPDNLLNFLEPVKVEGGWEEDKVVDSAHCGCAVGAFLICKRQPKGVTSMEVAYAMLAGLEEDEIKARLADNDIYQLKHLAGATESGFDGPDNDISGVWADVGRAYNAYHVEARYEDDPPNTHSHRFE